LCISSISQPVTVKFGGTVLPQGKTAFCFLKLSVQWQRSV